MIHTQRWIISFGLLLAIFIGVVVVSHTAFAQLPAPGSGLASGCNQELVCVDKDGNTLSCEETGVAGNKFSDPCTLTSAMVLIRKLIHFVAIDLSLPIAAIGFAIAGGMYMMSAVSSDKRKKAKDVILYIVYGLLIVISAWLIVEAIFRGLGYSSGVLIFN